MKLYEYAAILDDEDHAEVVVTPDWTLAEDEAHCLRIASRQIPDEYEDRLVDIKILVRPFV